MKQFEIYQRSMRLQKLAISLLYDKNGYCILCSSMADVVELKRYVEFNCKCEEELLEQLSEIVSK